MSMTRRRIGNKITTTRNFIKYKYIFELKKKKKNYDGEKKLNCQKTSITRRDYEGGGKKFNENTVDDDLVV